MGEPAERRPTYDDVLNAPDHVTAEILNGELFLSPRPAMVHAATHTSIVGDVRAAFGRRGGGWLILLEPELHLGEPDPKTVIAVPDVAGWRRDRVVGLDEAPASTVAPDWVCEVLSPGARNRRRDRIIKPVVYASCGVSHVWIVDPLEQTLEVLRLDGATYRIVQAFGGEDRVRAEPFDAVELDLAEWWPPSAG